MILFVNWGNPCNRSKFSLNRVDKQLKSYFKSLKFPLTLQRYVLYSTVDKYHHRHRLTSPLWFSSFLEQLVTKLIFIWKDFLFKREPVNSPRSFIKKLKLWRILRYLFPKWRCIYFNYHFKIHRTLNYDVVETHRI